MIAITNAMSNQLVANQDQSARKQEQIARGINTLQAAEQDISQKIPICPHKRRHVFSRPNLCSLMHSNI